MFLNVSNHPSDKWSPEQLAAAEKYGEIRDLPFPTVLPYWDIASVCKLADALFEEISAMQPDAVLCQGEMTLTYQLVKRLHAAEIPVFCACSDRISEEIRLPDGSVCLQ